MEVTQKTERLFMRSDPAFIRRVDEWRRMQPDTPSRSEAIRRLVDLGPVTTCAPGLGATKIEPWSGPVDEGLHASQLTSENDG